MFALVQIYVGLRNNKLYDTGPRFPGSWYLIILLKIIHSSPISAYLQMLAIPYLLFPNSFIFRSISRSFFDLTFFFARLLLFCQL